VINNIDHDPYAGNILTSGLGPILSRQEVLNALTYLPNMPADVASIPRHIRMHFLMNLRDLHVPSLTGAQVHTTIDLSIRQNYRYRDPNSSSTWRRISGDAAGKMLPNTPASAALVTGLAGSGKTQAISRSLGTYPTQIIVHDRFPNIAGKHTQVTWLSVDVPASGRSEDLGANLMMAWDRATDGNRFAASLSRARRNGMQMLDEFKQVASSHFLGFLHFDEIQNFFKIPTLERRRKTKGPKEALELSIVEDACLKNVLTFSNTWQMPTLFSGTPDGVGAMMKRFATSQRFVTMGYHAMPDFSSESDPAFADAFFPLLCKYQFVRTKIPPSEKFGRLIYQRSGGVRRIIIALWVAAHRVAFERTSDDLRFEDFEVAYCTYLSPLMLPIEALLSKDPMRMSRYEDLMPRDDGFWVTFWSNIQGQ
jgi:hypothetical protein